MVIVRKATEHDLKFMIECANKDWSINDYSGEFDLWLETIGLKLSELCPLEVIFVLLYTLSFYWWYHYSRYHLKTIYYLLFLILIH